jgi:hypothetical protein
MRENLETTTMREKMEMDWRRVERESLEYCDMV